MRTVKWTPLKGVLYFSKLH